MSITIRLPPTLADRIGTARIELATASLGECLLALTAQFPDISRIIWDASGELNTVVLLFRNNKLLRRARLDMALTAGDEIDIVPSIEAG